MISLTRLPRLSPRRAIWAALLAVLVATGALLGGNVLSGRWQIHPVISGSMRPGLAVGSVVVVQREPVSKLALRDVILTNPPDDPHFQVIHRVISLTPAAGGPVVQTQGDANAAPDPWQVRIHSPYVYKARFSVPLVGYAALAVHSPRGRQVTLGIAVLLCLLACANWLLQRRRQDDGTRTPAPTS